jgi:hypothetical protein
MDLAAAGKVRYPVRRGTLAVDLIARVGAPGEMLSEGHALERPAAGLQRYARRQAGESDWEREVGRGETRVLNGTCCSIAQTGRTVLKMF